MAKIIEEIKKFLQKPVHEWPLDILDYFNEFLKKVLLFCFLVGLIVVIFISFNTFNTFSIPSESPIASLYTYIHSSLVGTQNQSHQPPVDKNQNNAPQVKSSKNTSELTRSDNILQRINNLLVYFSILVIVVTLFLMFIGIRWIREYVELKSTVEKAEKGVLDAALATVSSVPITSMTQITSSEHYEAIRTITRTVSKNGYNIEEDADYVPLLIIKALNYWINSEYKLSERILKKAYYLAKDDNRNKIAFHLSRVYKQLAVETHSNNLKKDYLEKSIKWADSCTDKDLKDTLLLSVKLIEKEFIKYKQIKTPLIEKDITVLVGESLDIDFDKISVDEIKNLRIINLSQWTAVTILAFRQDELRETAAKRSLEIFEDMISNEKGYNLKAAWYLTMAELAYIVGKNDKKAKYLNLCKMYYEMSEKHGVKKLFIFRLLAKVDLNNFKNEWPRLEDTSGTQEGST